MLPNEQIAQRFDEVARILNERNESSYRVEAWRHAAMSLRRLPVPVSEIYAREGEAGLRKIPGVGAHIGTALRGVLLTGRLAELDHLRDEPESTLILRTVPGIGPVQAARLHRDLGINSLEDLEAASQSGLLRGFAGFGEKRIAGIADSLASRLGRLRPQRSVDVPDDVPVEILLDIDREYRESAASGKLRRIAPRRFNPGHEVWLPILHTYRNGSRYTALYSNTARAHQLGRTGDWVVIYGDGQPGANQWTIVTANRGPLRGRRIVRGREAECALAAPSPGSQNAPTLP